MLRIDSRALAALYLLAVLPAGAALHVYLWKSETAWEDVYYAWVEGHRILVMENPYARILDGDMRENRKYATYFPLFYELSSLAQLAGLRQYGQWIALWRFAFLLFDMGITVLMFYIPYQRRMPSLAVFGTMFWLFNRWTLHVTEVAHIDFIPILFLLWSLALFGTHRRWALLLISLSLGMKQIAIFVVPLYLIWVWQDTRESQLKEVLKAGALIASVPALASLPFIIWNMRAFVLSILFSVTRSPEGHFGVMSVDTYLGLDGFLARLPMLGLLALSYWLVWRRTVGMYTAVLLVLAAFTGFNPVLFRVYLAWLTPFLPLAVCDSTPPGMLGASTSERVASS
ncbi:MAG: hypothetical protein AB1714_30680 [Acidobacteriota bacterium]